MGEPPRKEGVQLVRGAGRKGALRRNQFANLAISGGSTDKGADMCVDKGFGRGIV